MAWENCHWRYAHDAAKFAARPGMPERALALDLRQAAVYLFHNGPERKLFIDGRLEVPSRATFESYVRLRSLLNEGQTGWTDAVRRMGDPLILLDHVEDAGAEATLLGQPGWRCVFFDPVASLFVVERTNAFPAVDFAARHFRDPAWRTIPPVPLGLAEAAALIKLGSALGRRPPTASSWALRFSLMLTACDRLRQGLAAGSRGGLQTGADRRTLEPDRPLFMEHGARLERPARQARPAVGPCPRLVDGAGDLQLSPIPSDRPAWCKCARLVARFIQSPPDGRCRQHTLVLAGSSRLIQAGE